jgi:ATP-dependent RNA helicase DeaD
MTGWRRALGRTKLRAALMPTHEPDASVTFDLLPLSQEVRRAVDELGFVTPTPVQRAVYEPAARGVDLVVQARTGTGKTAAFGLPIINSLVRRASADVQSLVLCPTRELALQVTQELEALGKHRGVLTVAIYGGAPMPRQIEQLRQGPQIVVGTPGRLLDHLRRGSVRANAVRVLVLDESDEMLSMGFLPQINEILSFLPDGRQTLLFSATLPPDIQRMAETRLRHPEFLTLSGDHVGALEVGHVVYWSYGDKVGDFIQMLEIEDPESAIVFCNTREQTRRVAAALEQQGYAADWLNADLGQSDREQVMGATRRGDIRFLVATDVAARGIDISHLTHVLNFDLPETAEGYVHRTGRTGRAGRTGTAISLVAPSDVGNLYLLRLTYGIRPVEKQLPTARELRTRAEADVVTSFAQVFGSRAVQPDVLALARRVLTHEQADIIVAGLLRGHLGDRLDAVDAAQAARRARAPAASAPLAPPADDREPPADDREPPADDREPPADDREPPRRSRRRSRRDQPGRPAPGSVAPAPEPTKQPVPEPTGESSPATPALADGATPVEIFVSVGRRDNVGPDELYALLERGGVERSLVTQVNVRHRHTFVKVAPEVLDKAIQALAGASIGGRRVTAEPARRVGLGPDTPP